MSTIVTEAPARTPAATEAVPGPRPFQKLESRLVPLPLENVDTDQIIPARYLKGTRREGLREGLFAHWRRRPDGSEDPDFVLHQERYRGAEILVAGDNFGCGSSREHAPWSLLDHGFRVVISTRFADIFRNNSLGNGLLVFTVPPELHGRLVEMAAEAVPATCSVDLERRELCWPGGTYRFDIDPFARHCLLRGIDRMTHLLEQRGRIQKFEQSRPPRVDTRVAWRLDPSREHRIV